MSIGTDILPLAKTDVEVTHISSAGLWLFADDAEFFVRFADYPTFLNATVRQLNEVTVDCMGNFHWTELDIDIERDALQAPERYPLYFKA